MKAAKKEKETELWTASSRGRRSGTGIEYRMRDCGTPAKPTSKGATVDQKSGTHDGSKKRREGA